MANAQAPVARRAGIYLRISETDDDLGVRRQERLCRELAERLGWQVVNVYEDNSRSAWSRKPRPAYLRMLEDIRFGKIDGVLAFGADRLHRNSEEHVAFLRLAAETGVIVQTITGGTLDHVTAGGKLQSKIAADVAEYESDIKSERVRAKMAELRAAGMTQGGRRPFGLTDGRKALVPEEANLIREAAAFVASGQKMYQLVRQWNQAGIRTVRGNPWSTTALREILISKWVRGLTPDGTSASWPRIIDEVTGRRLDAILLDPSRKRRRPEVERHLLTGLLVCGRCDATMQSANGNGHRGYGCRVCHRMRQMAAPLEEDIFYRLLSRLDNLKIGAAVIRLADVDADDSELRDLEAKRELYLEMFDAGEITRAELRDRRQRLDARIAEVEGRMRRDVEAEMRRQVRAESFDMMTRWESLDLEQRRTVLEAFIEKIIVRPAKKGRTTYDARRSEVIWR